MTEGTALLIKRFEQDVEDFNKLIEAQKELIRLNEKLDEMTEQLNTCRQWAMAWKSAAITYRLEHKKESLSWTKK